MNTTHNKLNVKNIALIALLVAISIAVKLVVQPLKIFTGSVGLPGGAVLGGLYMMWLVLAVSLTGIKYAGTLVSAVQAIITFAAGLSVSFGWMTIAIYLASGIVSDLVLLISRYRYNALVFVIACCLANIVGTYLTNVAIFNMPLVPLLIMTASSALSGCIGGIIAYAVHCKISKMKAFQLQQQDEDQSEET